MMTLLMMLRREMIAITVAYVLRHTALLPTSGDHVVQWGSKSRKTVLQQIGGNAVIFQGFVWLQLLDAMYQLVHSWFSIKLIQWRTAYSGIYM